MVLSNTPNRKFLLDFKLEQGLTHIVSILTNSEGASSAYSCHSRDRFSKTLSDFRFLFFFSDFPSFVCVPSAAFKQHFIDAKYNVLGISMPKEDLPTKKQMPQFIDSS
jgi:hypothetical protein